MRGAWVLLRGRRIGARARHLPDRLLATSRARALFLAALGLAWYSVVAAPGSAVQGALAGNVDAAVDSANLNAGETDLSSSARIDSGYLLEAVMHSDILQWDYPYRVYLPSGYYSSQERYPVLYLLHGNGGDYTEWTEGNLVANFASVMMAGGRIRKMIIAMPEGDHGFFMNWVGGTQRWSDYVVKEIIPLIDSRYRTIPDRQHRAIGGNSGGGEAALQLAFNHPDLFSVVGAHTPSLRLDLTGAPTIVFGDWNYYADYDPVRLALTRGGLSSLQIWVDAAEMDPYLPATQKLHENLLSRGIDHQWHIFPGIHFTTEWILHMPEYLDYYSGALEKAAAR